MRQRAVVLERRDQIVDRRGVAQGCEHPVECRRAALTPGAQGPGGRFGWQRQGAAMAARPVVRQVGMAGAAQAVAGLVAKWAAAAGVLVKN